jgi:hypothetical protein
MIKFQQYDNYAISTDGFAFDDIRLYAAPDNQSPAADAGLDQTAAEETLVQLDGSASADPDAWPLPLTYTWTQTAGTAVATLWDADTAAPSFTAPSLFNGDETLIFELEVCDGLDCSVSSVQILVQDSGANDAPIADAGPDQTVGDFQSVWLDASASTDPDGGPQPLEYAWTQIAGPAVLLDDSLIANPRFTAPEVTASTVLRFSLQICDGELCDNDEVMVIVNPIDAALLPFVEDFDGGVMSANFTTASSKDGRIQVTADNDLTMDSVTRGGYSLNELTLMVNLEAQPTAVLDFYHKEFGDEDHALPATFTGSAYGDGVAISVDCDNWCTIQGLTSADGIIGNYQLFSVDLIAAATACGYTPTARTLIRFQQYDNYPIATDGFGFDAISISP